MNDAVLFSNRIKEFRGEMGLSQSELASAVGVSRNTISSIETGQYSPTAKLAYSLCLVLNKSFEEVFYFEGMESSQELTKKAAPALPEGRLLNRLMRLLTDEGWSAERILSLIHRLTLEDDN